MIRDGYGPEQLLETALGGIDFNLLERKEVRFHCHCSHERALKIIASLGEEEITDMLVKDSGAELNCHFCNSVYQVKATELEQILNELNSTTR